MNIIKYSTQRFIMKLYNQSRIGLTATLICILFQLSGTAQTIFWSESVANSIKRVNVSVTPVLASTATTIASPSVPVFLFVDTRNALVYWADNGTGSIIKTNIGGGALTTVVSGITGSQVYLRSIYLDVTNNLMYWSQTGAGLTDKIRRVNISGALPKLASTATDVVTGIDIVRGITLDTTANQVYFVDAGSAGSGRGIYRASLTTPPVIESAATKIAATPIAAVTPQPNSLFIDKVNSFLYWADYANPGGKIQRAATNAGAYPVVPTDVYTGASIKGISLNTTTNTIYWVEPLNAKIRKASLSTIPITTPTDAVTGISNFSRNLVFVGNGVVLPVTFISIGAVQQGSGVQVQWKIGTEINIDNYTIERSPDGITFSQVGVTAARGNVNGSSYTFFDQSPFSGNNYYRIIAVNRNGNLQYSSVVRINLSTGKEDITIYPNPALGGNFSLQLQNLKKGKFNVNLYNNLGQVVVQQFIDHNGGNSVQTFELPFLSAGTYKLQVVGNNAKFTKSIIIK